MSVNRDMSLTSEEKISEYYDKNIEPLFNGYVNDKHKKDCMDGILALYKYLKENKITYEKFENNSDVIDDIIEFFGKTHVYNGIPLYLEEITGDHSESILCERQDELIKFLLTL
jgi:hypothetical protein